MGFGRGKGFTAKARRVVESGAAIKLEGWGWLIFQTAWGYLISTVSVEALATTPISKSISGKLTSSKSVEIT